MLLDSAKRVADGSSCLYRCEDSVGFADDADDHGTLLDGFLCIFDLEDTALGRAGGWC